MFHLREDNERSPEEITDLPLPEYLCDNIKRILAVTSEIYQLNEPFTRMI